MKSIIKIIRNANPIHLHLASASAVYYMADDFPYSSYKVYSSIDDESIYGQYRNFYIFKHRKNRVYAFHSFDLYISWCIKLESYEKSI